MLTQFWRSRIPANRAVKASCFVPLDHLCASKFFSRESLQGNVGLRRLCRVLRVYVTADSLLSTHTAVLGVDPGWASTVLSHHKAARNQGRVSMQVPHAPRPYIPYKEKSFSEGMTGRGAETLARCSCRGCSRWAEGGNCEVTRPKSSLSL